MSSSEETNRRSNRLLHETSPYLHEHAYNPVDWYPWGTEAFQRSKRENKPIFLSIGYSSCHWCHQMRKESFEDPEVAKILNDNFVSIKVDREERPDVDEIYMKAVMSMTGSGGWPLSVFLTPSLEPFYGGTYFPPSPRYGMPSFSNILRNVSRAWKSDRKEIVQSAGQMKAALVEMFNFKKAENAELNASVLDECYSQLVGSFDEQRGGFGDAPKFPMPSNLFFLLRYHKRKNSQLALKMATKTLDSMMRGGIFDQIGGGFHRYSTDRYWLVPHFEKMLYDNALLSQVYSEAYVLTRNGDYARIVNEVLGWAIREMRDPNGGFYSAQDADSPDGEGSYYVWTRNEIESLLSKDPQIGKKWELVANYFSVTGEGNFEDQKNILTAKPERPFAKETGPMSVEEFDALLSRAKNIMLEYRYKRARPGTDDKVLTSWNGLMISALSKAYSALGDSKYLSEAVATGDFLLTHLASYDPEHGLVLARSFREGKSSGGAVLEDYSFLANGLIDLYEASLESRFLVEALQVSESMIAQFFDEVNGGFFQTSAQATNLIARPKDAFDGALPSGNSMACLAILRLAEITTRDDMSNKAKDTLLGFWDAISRQPSSFCQMLVALAYCIGPRKEIVISGHKHSTRVKEFLDIIRGEFVPNSIVLVAEKQIEEISPLVKGRVPGPSQEPVVYVCSDFACKLPSKTLADLENSLKD